MKLMEETLTKIEKLTNQVIETPLKPTNTIVDKTTSKLKNTKIGNRIITNLEKNPSLLSKKQNAKEWAGLMAGGTLASHLPQIASGDFITPAALAVGNAAKGAVIGPMLSGNQDTLLRSSLIPAGVVAITTPLLNDVGDAFNLGNNIDFSPEARVGLTAGVGGGMWAFRNRKNKNRVYI